MTEKTELERSAELCNASPDYKVLSRLKELNLFMDDAGVKTFTGIAVDTETTGLDTANDKIIELSIVSFEFDMEGNIYSVGECYSAFEDPGEPLSDEVKDITGIVDDDVEGQYFNDKTVEALFDISVVTIAHNSKFDRVLMERRFPQVAHNRWGCSLNDIDWFSEEVFGRTLSALAAIYGFFFDAHRAEVDVRAGIEILRNHDVNGQPLLKQVLDAVKASTYELWAFNAPFDAKDTLKGNGYSWHPGDERYGKAWHKPVLQEDLESELGLLEQHVMPLLRSSFEVELVDSLIRYSNQKGEMKPVTAYLSSNEPAPIT
jgi:DNA polymerase-3 subunit epsilon